MKTKLIMESWRRFLKEQTEEQGMKSIFVLVGPPAVGKSTWIKKTFGDIKPYIVSRDTIVDEVAAAYGWTYDDMFVNPALVPADKVREVKLEDGTIQKIPYHSKYGDVQPAPSYMKWPGAPKQVYSKVMEANGEIHSKHLARTNAAKDSGQDIVVDMTNMDAAARGRALAILKDRESEYKKIAVVFTFEGAEDIIKGIAAERAKVTNKTIPDEVMNNMMKKFEKVDSSEGFDEIIPVDNREALKQELERITAEES
jgi:predicted kinase